MVGFVWFVVGLSLSFSPPSDCISLPSMMTWAPCPHGVRTRGKKCASPTSKLTGLSGHSSGGGWQKAHSMAPPLGTFQRRLTVPALRTCVASVKHLLHPGKPVCIYQARTQVVLLDTQKTVSALCEPPSSGSTASFAFVSRCCSQNNQHRRQIASAAKAV